MGFMKGNKGKDKEDPQQKTGSQRKSRRVVVPGGKPATKPAAPASPQQPPSSRVQRPAQGGGTGRVVRPTADPAPKPDSGRVPKPADDGFMLAPSAEPAPARPKTREPILDSQPLAFSGDLSTASGAGTGPVRTGDQALLDFLVNKANLITQDQAAAARQRAEADQTAIDVALVAQGAVTEDQLVSALTQECWVPHLRVDKYEIRKKALDTIAREDAIRCSVFPVDKLGSLLTLAMVNPLDTETIRQLEGKTGLDIKKVVATRSEINQGIEKYYSGAVQAKDTSISFTQDVEPKSVTQMLHNVSVKDQQAAAVAPVPEPTLDMDEPAIVTPPKSMPTPSIDVVPEIEDIDDLLSSDEVIAPAIIEPIGIEPIAADEIIEDIEPAAIPVNEIEPIGINPGAAEPISDEFSDIAISEPEPVARSQESSDLIDIGAMDLSLDDTEAVVPKAKAPAPAPISDLLPAPEFLVDDEDSDARISVPAPKGIEELSLDDIPAAKAPAPAPAPIPVAKPAAPAPIPVAKPAAPAPTPVAKPAAPAPVAKPAAPAAKAPVAKPTVQVINLIPVMEEEFQHAITHGKAHLFERWVGLQTRNRIINGVAVEAELDELLAGLYAAPRRVG